MDHPELMDDLRLCVSTGQRVERELRDVGGKSFFLRVLPYRTRSTIDGVVLTLIDVTGLKAAEDALFHERYLLNSLLSSVPDAIYFKDARGRFIRANDAMAVRLGLAHPREAAGKTAGELATDGWLLTQAIADDAVVHTGHPQRHTLESRSSRNGEEQWDVVTRLPLTDREGRVVGMFGVCRDVTLEKRAEEKIQEAVRRRDQFLAMLSHELRNPLGAIVTALKLLKMGDVAEETRARCMKTLDHQSSQMARLLDDLLDASRVTQNKIELRRRIVDLRDVLREAAEGARGFIEARGLELHVSMHPAAIYVDGDPARLQQIHMNLLNNAAKYTPRGGHVELTLSRDEGDAVVRVRDDGMGISPAMLDSVFELFVQAERTLDRSDGGLGVGLTLVRALVGMHGGTVTASSDGPGKGSLFEVRLPLTLAPESSVPLRSSPPPAAMRRGAPRVAIIEDNEDSRQMLCALLTESGVECRSAGTGTAGLALLFEMRPDVALIDVGLPEMDGLEVARRVRAHPELARTHLIALTGYGQPSDREAARQAGFDGHLVKPVNPDDLLAFLSESRDEAGTA
jgi:two-component system CheB/CheR fusion protein